eukprot:UN32468
MELFYTFPLVVEVITGRPFLDIIRRSLLFQLLHDFTVGVGLFYVICAAVQLWGCQPGYTENVDISIWDTRIYLCDPEMPKIWSAFCI